MKFTLNALQMLPFPTGTHARPLARTERLCPGVGIALPSHAWSSRCSVHKEIRFPIVVIAMVTH